MKRCIHCSKKGIFLKLNAQKLCFNCVMKIEKEKEKAQKINKTEERIEKEANQKLNETVDFETYYSELILYLKEIRENINVGHNPITALKYVQNFTKKYELCEKLLTEIHNPKYADKFIDKIINSIEYSDDFHKQHGMGIVKDWEINIYSSYNKKYSSEEILKSLDKLLETYKYKLKTIISGLKRSAVFQEKIDNIPTIEITLTDKKIKKQSTAELDELIKYTNISSKTNFDKIGSFIVIDTETTGLSSAKDSIIEIAAIKFDDWTPISKFHTLINPGKHIPEEASNINNITDDMVNNSPSFAQIVDCLISFIGESNIVGHNLPFDLKFLYRHGYDFTSIKRKYYDTCEISKKILKKPKMKWDKEFKEYLINDNYDYDVIDYKLTTLSNYYDIRDNLFAHRALSDAFATGLLFQKLVESKVDY